MGLNLEDHLDEVFEVIKIHLLALILIFIVLMTKKQIKQTGYEQFAFYWYLFNGAIIHVTWDGLIGALHYCEPVIRAYSLMDNRYKVKENMVYTISLCELVVYGPLCLYTARLYLNSRGIRRDLLSIISSFIQLLGTVYFFFDEYLNQFVNVCPEGSCFTFSPNNIGYFWICFICFNPVWIIIPSYHMYVAYKNIAAQDKWTFQNCPIENNTGDKYYEVSDKSEKVVKSKKSKKE